MALVTSEVSYGSPGRWSRRSQHRLLRRCPMSGCRRCRMLPGRRLSTSRRCRTGCQPTSLPVDRFRTRLGHCCRRGRHQPVSRRSVRPALRPMGDRVVALDAQGTFVRAVGQTGRVKGHGNGVCARRWRRAHVGGYRGPADVFRGIMPVHHHPVVVSPVTFITMCIPGKPRSPVGGGSGTPQAAAAR